MNDNPYYRTPVTREESNDIETLNEADCWRLLEGERLARLAVVDEFGADIFPINYLVHDGFVFFRSAPGTKIVSLTENPGVAVEIDGTEHGKRFSVVVRGEAHRLNDDQLIEKSGVKDLVTQTSSEKWNYFDVRPRFVTGIRFRTSR